MAEKIVVHARIEGRVQGVFYRAETRRQAQKLGVNGWVRNRADGTVEAVFEGEKGRVEAMLSWCRQGPPSAIVEKVTSEAIHDNGGYNDFSIRY